MNVTKVPWESIHGSIFTLHKYRVKSEVKVPDQQVAVAFNVGDEVAARIVMLHNANLSNGWNQATYVAKVEVPAQESVQ